MTHPNKKETFGQELKRSRIEQGCSVAKQAKELNVSKDLYKAWEADKAVPTSLAFKRMCCWVNSLADWNEFLAPARAAGLTEPVPEAKKPTKKQNFDAMLIDCEVVALSVMSVAEAVCHARVSLGLSAEDLAALLEVSAEQVYAWESQGPSAKELEKLKSVFPELATSHKRPPGLASMDSYALLDGKLGWLGDGPATIPSLPASSVKGPPPMEPKYSVVSNDDPTIGWARALVDVASSPDRSRFVDLLELACTAGWPKDAILETLAITDSDQIQQFAKLLKLSDTLGFDIPTLSNAIGGGK